MMVKEASVPRAAETLIRRGDDSSDALKVKTSQNSLLTTETVKNGVKGSTSKPPTASFQQQPQPMPATRFRRNARAASAERSILPKSTSYSSSSIASSRDSSVASPNSGSAQFFVASTQKSFNNVYEKLLWEHQFDEASQRDVTLGRRVGFYKFKSELGSGNFSKVKLAVHQITKEQVAVKIINKSRLDSKTQKMVQREMKIMDSLSHPNLIRLFEVCETVTGIHLVMEMAPNGELFAKLSEEGPYREAQAKGIFAQIASAVEYMHENYFIHRDLKAENVFFANRQVTIRKSNREVVVYPIVKVGDFGFATQVSNIDQHLNTFCGSPPYAAPELFKDDHYVGPAVDIWALGILLYFLVTGSMPFKGNTVAALKHSILEGKFDIPESLSEACMELIRGILRKKPEWRLNMLQIRESRWLLGVDWPSADSKFRPFPVRGPVEPDELSSEEVQIRSELEGLGIGAELLESQVERGNRSPIIGAYRILMHRLINGTVRKGSRDWSVLECQSVDTDYSSNLNNRVRISAKLRSTTFSDNAASAADNDVSATHYERRNKKSKNKNSKFCAII